MICSEVEEAEWAEMGKMKMQKGLGDYTAVRPSGRTDNMELQLQILALDGARVRDIFT